MDRKTLYLMRHAKSNWSAAGLSDFDRPLNERGFRDAPEMGRRLKARGALPEVILCSPARRTMQTFEKMAIGVPNVIFDERIYDASMGVLLDMVQTLENRFDSAMLIGHNPAMTWLVNQLSGAGIHTMPTCAVAMIELDSSHWAKAGSCPGALLDFDYPEK